jgi:hypothetical protein
MVVGNGIRHDLDQFGRDAVDFLQVSCDLLCDRERGPKAAGAILQSLNRPGDSDLRAQKGRGERASGREAVGTAAP